MARVKAVKIPPCATRAEFETKVDEFAKMSVRRDKLVAELKAKHQALDDKFGAEIKNIERDMQDAHERASLYFEDHAGELVKPGTRSGSTKLANFGVRLGLPTVTKTGKFKKVAWKALGLIFDGIKELKQFVRNQPEVNKDAILDVFRDLKSEDAAIAAAAQKKKKVLDKHGISMVQEEDFWIDPIADHQVK